MKCPRCQAEMQRRKLREHAYQYRCAKCGFTVGAKEQKDGFQEAYNDAMMDATNDEK